MIIQNGKSHADKIHPEFSSGYVYLPTPPCLFESSLQSTCEHIRELLLKSGLRIHSIVVPFMLFYLR